GLVVAGKARVLKFAAEPRRHVRGHRNAALPALGVEAQRGRVLARELDEILAAGRALQAYAVELGGGVLAALDVRELRKPLHRLDRNVDHRAARNVVDEDRNADGVVD